LPLAAIGHYSPGYRQHRIVDAHDDLFRPLLAVRNNHAEPATEIPTTHAAILIMGKVYSNRTMEATSLRKKASLFAPSFRNV